jgi:hypothetical protein
MLRAIPANTATISGSCSAETNLSAPRRPLTAERPFRSPLSLCQPGTLVAPIGGYSRGSYRGLRHVGSPVTERLRSMGGLLRATHTIGVAQCAPKRSSHLLTWLDSLVRIAGPRSGPQHPGGPRREIRRRCHLIVTFTRTGERKIVKLRGFEPLTFCMPYISLLFRNVAGCGSTRSFNRCTSPAGA